MAYVQFPFVLFVQLELLTLLAEFPELQVVPQVFPVLQFALFTQFPLLQTVFPTQLEAVLQVVPVVLPATCGQVLEVLAPFVAVQLLFCVHVAAVEQFFAEVQLVLLHDWEPTETVLVTVLPFVAAAEALLLIIAPTVPDTNTHAIKASIFVFMYYLLFLFLGFPRLKGYTFVTFLVTNSNTIRLRRQY
jgi:hypothetical protein